MMNLQLPGRKSWAGTLLLAGMSLIIATRVASAQSPHSFVDADAVMVSLNDTDVDVDSELDAGVAQVGFLEHGWSESASSCGGCGKSSSRCCCTPWWAHRTGLFGQFLLLRPGNVDQIYTIEQNTVVPGNDPTGPVGRVNVDEESGFRTGLSWAATECTSLVASYSWFEGHSSNTIAATGSNVLISQTIHPSTLNVGTGSLQTSANYNIDFQLIDLGYRHIWKTSDIYAINWLAGFRYGNLEQDLSTLQDLQVAIGEFAVDVDVDFDGFGMMFGVDGERRSSHSGLLVYGKALSSFMAGDWRADYLQINTVTAGGEVANDYEDYRVTPVLELELGFGWQSKCGKWRAQAGYLTSAWYDAISTRQYVNAVRTTNYVNIDETITFSGLTAGVEARF